jgi:hypothetical protein
MSFGQRPLGGRFTEWTNGTFVALGGEGAEIEGRRVITAPLPKPEAFASPPPAAPPSAPEETPPPPSNREGAERKKAVPIREHAAMDKLLSALEYERPYIPELKRETNGDPSAAHASEAHLPPAGVDTGPLEPRTKLSDSLALEIAAPRATPAPPLAALVDDASSREVPTVTRSFSAARRRRGGVAAFAVLALLGGAMVFAFVSFRSAPPLPSSAAGAPPPSAPASASAAPSVVAMPEPASASGVASASTGATPPPQPPPSAAEVNVAVVATSVPAEPLSAKAPRRATSAPRVAPAPSAAASAAPLPFRPHTELEEQN